MSTSQNKLIKALKNPYWAFERAYIKNRNVLKKYIPTRYKPMLKKVENALYLKINRTYKYIALDLRKHLPLKYQAKNSFTVVTAIYNVEKYLDEFFESIVKQNIDFKKYIQIICVDDGSIDKSAQIIKKWQKKYPNNIHYYYKENGGQASARNLGLEYVKTDWVTFIDPDDFINHEYFRVIDLAIAEDNHLNALVTNLIFYYENKKVLRDGHPLRYRFYQKEPKMLISHMKENINLSASSTVFRTDVIRSNRLFFDHKIKPNFEDGKFIADYFLVSQENKKIQFLKDAQYFYRKREDGSSTLDKSWCREAKFFDVLQYGFLPMLESYYQKYEGKIPYHIQKTALYDMVWYVVYLVNSPEKQQFLSDEQRDRFQVLLEQIFTYIDAKTILNFNLAGIWWFQKVGMLGCFKKEAPEKQIVYIESVDREKKQILLSYFTTFDCLDSIKFGDKDITPRHSKTVKNTFNNRLFAYEKRYWISYADVDLEDKLSIWIENKASRISLQNKHHMFLVLKDILTAFTPSNKYKTDGSWLLMDRETKADDNAEHLYRYLMQQHPEQKCYFALNRDSQDWERLSVEGFNLVAFGEAEFELCLRKCSKIISSHIEAHIHNYFGDLYEGSKKFVFLQHGVTKDNLSRWLNGKKHVASFVTTTKDEYQSIAYGESYKFTDKEMVLTGFPRHDNLYEQQNKVSAQKILLVMPTWRHYLMGTVVGKGANVRELNPKFLDSTYAKAWMSFLGSKKLASLVEEHGYQVIFAPHPNIAPYLDQMSLPDYLEIWHANQSVDSIQDLFIKAQFLITDYSSVGFEMAYIGKPTLYYQFDKDEFFAGNHSYQKGYFEYEKDGFGPVVTEEKELFKELEIVLKNNGSPLEPYKTRIQDTFLFRDGKNCERVYQAIMALDEPDSGELNIQILKERIQKAYEYQSWAVVESRLSQLSPLEVGVDESYMAQIHIEALMNLHKFAEAERLLEKDLFILEEKKKYKAIMAYIQGRWEQSIYYWEQLDNVTIDDQLKLLKAYAKLDEAEKCENLSQYLLSQPLTSSQKVMVELIVALSYADWQQVLAKDISEFSLEERVRYQPELIFAEAYRMLEMFDQAHQQLVDFEKHSTNVIALRVEIALLAFAKENYKKVISQLESAFKGIFSLMPRDLFICYAVSLEKTEQVGKLNEIKKMYEGSLLQHDFTKEESEKALQAYHNVQWEQAIYYWEQLDKLSIDEQFKLLKAYAQLVKKEKCESLAKEIGLQHLTSSQKLMLELLLARSNEDWIYILTQQENMSKFSLKDLIRYQPELIFAEAYRALGLFEQANRELVIFEYYSAANNVLEAMIEKARLAFAKENYKEVISQLEVGFKEKFFIMPDDLFNVYLTSLEKTKQETRLVNILYDMRKEHGNAYSHHYIKIEIKNAFYCSQWLFIVNKTTLLSEEQKSELIYEISTAYLKLGLFDEFKSIYQKPTIHHEYKYWKLIYDFSIFSDDQELEQYCYRYMTYLFGHTN